MTEILENFLRRAITGLAQARAELLDRLGIVRRRIIRSAHQMEGQGFGDGLQIFIIRRII